MATVFLSYRREGENPKLVRDLATRLEGAGLTVIFDEFAQEREFNYGGPQEGWPIWCDAQAGNLACKTLIVGSSGWFSRYEGTAVSEKNEGLGAATEAGVIRQRIFNAQGILPNIRIVMFTEPEPNGIPLGLQRYHRFLHPRDFANLTHWLTGIGPAQPAAVSADWPDAPLAMKWSMADHNTVPGAFAELLAGDAAFRFLPIRGPSDTGKSHITKKLLGAALQCTAIACGRFDFKGTTDIDAEFQRLTQNLEVPAPPPAQNLSQRLSAILGALTARARPTLLIFDTFEAAGPAEQWVNENLLVALIRAPWLRIVIAGQRAPERAGAPWEAVAREPIDLMRPGPDDWFAFGRENKRDITQDFARQVHEQCKGKASILAQVFGPQ